MFLHWSESKRLKIIQSDVFLLLLLLNIRVYICFEATSAVPRFTNLILFYALLSL